MTLNGSGTDGLGPLSYACAERHADGDPGTPPWRPRRSRRRRGCRDCAFTLRVTDAGVLYAEDSVTEDQRSATPADGQTLRKRHLRARFSEEPADGFSYQTLRDHAFTATGGEVVNARRLEKGKNVRWEIHVTPDGDGTVTVVLPVTTDCAATGAVCTGDGRMLSNRLEITVPGPGG